MSVLGKQTGSAKRFDGHNSVDLVMDGAIVKVQRVQECFKSHFLHSYWTLLPDVLYMFFFNKD